MHRDVHTQECSARSSAHLTVVHWPLHVGIPGILHGCNIFRVKMVVASHKPNTCLRMIMLWCHSFLCRQAWELPLLSTDSASHQCRYFTQDYDSHLHVNIKFSCNWLALVSSILILCCYSHINRDNSVQECRSRYCASLCCRLYHIYVGLLYYIF